MTAGTRGTHHAYARLVLETMPEESRVGLALGFIRTFGIPDIARVLYGTGRMTSEPRARAKATGVAMFTLIGQGLDSPEGRSTVDALRRIHDRPDITPELMHYVLACFTVCPLRFIDMHGHRPVTEEEREAAYAFHLGLSDALDLPELPGGGDLDGVDGLEGREDGLEGLDGVEHWMRGYEARHFAPTKEARALWHSASHGLLAARLPSALARLAPTVAASLLDASLSRTLQVRRPPAPVRALVAYVLRSKARGRVRASRGTE
ncbi:DUF2236 domain-containing protein [Streptomyces sp. NPDC059479]|uniref:DUF2236 domain-containing protein n=1 Tax=Streptomyces sp. NPDC059479 TaxID=3346848 RepID=UPI0036984457